MACGGGAAALAVGDLQLGQRQEWARGKKNIRIRIRIIITIPRESGVSKGVIDCISQYQIISHLYLTMYMDVL